MLLAVLLQSVVVSFDVATSHISEMIDGANEYLGNAGSFQLKIAANDPCVLKLHNELVENCALSTDDKSRLAIQWMNCMREGTGRRTVSNRVSELDEHIYSSEFILYLHRVETLCFWIDQRRKDIFDAWWKDRQYQLLSGLQHTTKSLLGIGERTVERILLPVAMVNFPSEGLLSHLGIFITERQWKKLGVASAVFFFVFPFLAPRTGYFQGIQFAPLFFIFGFFLELLAFFMDVNYSLEEETEELLASGWLGYRTLQPGDLLIAALVLSYLCLLVGGMMHYRRTRMSDVYRRVEHINSGCKKIDNHVLKLCEAFKTLNLSDENQNMKNFCILCGKRTTPYDITISTPISISINPEKSRQDSMNISQPNGFMLVTKGSSIPSSNDTECIDLNAGTKREIHHNGNHFTVVSKQQSVEEGMFTGKNVASFLVILFFFFPSYAVWIIRGAMDKINQLYI